jgi:hypothetical protein
MGQAKTNKLYRTFVKGLVTEASPLTYPEDTTLDELNTVPFRKGNRQRRYGINYNPSNSTPRPYDSTRAKSEFVWAAVAAKPALTFLVVQNDNEVSFYDRSQQAFAANKKAFTVDLNSYTRPGVSTAGALPCHFAAGKGILFIVNQDVEPLSVSYDPNSDSISVNKIVIQMRDYEGVPDGLANDAEPSQLSVAHFYNLLNQGWVAP